ncbi:MAG TPA: NIL domain-containing protein [Anaerolineae bacterium]|jgi:ABC-type methionine transport system ATPase subunit|nr:NIL domain-containing protein [Anaerolineae bacterium]
MIIERKVRLRYPQRLLDRPLIYGLIDNFQLLTNILEAKVDAEQGVLLLAVRGEAHKLQEGLAWMAEQGVEVEVLSESGEGQ